MPDTGPTPAAVQPSARRDRGGTWTWTWTWAWGALVVAIAAGLVFGIGLAEEPHFVDESAMISQSYFADLLLAGDRDNAAWLDYPGYDVGPLHKYLIGIMLRFGG